MTRRDAGFTLVELMIGMGIGLIVILGGMTILDSTLRISRTTQGRVDSAQRGRIAMETITRELRSQVCLSATAPALTTGTENNVVFYVNLGVVDSNPERHEIALSGGDIVLKRFVGTGTPPSMTFSGTPTSTRTLLENVATVSGVPFLRYYAWQNGNPVLPTTLLPAPLSASNLGRPVKIAVSFKTFPNRDFRTTSASTTLQNAVFVRAADPVDTTNGPRC